MHHIFKLHDVVFLIFQMVHMTTMMEGPGRLGGFAALATTSSTISEVILQLLWKRLPSVEPLIHLIPQKFLKKIEISDGIWELVGHLIC
jgi:hypothetical protein